MVFGTNASGSIAKFNFPRPQCVKRTVGGWPNFRGGVPFTGYPLAFFDVVEQQSEGDQSDGENGK